MPNLSFANNQGYHILKLNILHYWREHNIPEHEFPSSFNLCEPDLHFDRIASAMGVGSVRVEKPEQIGPAIQKALSYDGPFLIDLVLTNEVQGAKIGVKCGQ